MFKCTLLIFSFCTFSIYASPFEFKIKSLKTTLSKPDTSHTLIYQSPASTSPKVAFLLSPKDNERLGFFIDINGIEIGYSADVFKKNLETKTQDILMSYRKFKHSKITFNYQTLEGLSSLSENLSANGADRRFANKIKSTKLELLGLHDLYTFNNKTSLFNHFFLNSPKLSNHFDWSLSIIGTWSYKNVTLEDPESILFTPRFLDKGLPKIQKLRSNSFNAHIGPFLSVSLPNNFNFFTEYKIGRGHIKNTDRTLGLKKSGKEKSNALGAGISWTSPDKKTLVLLRGWNQKGRHIETAFGDLSLINFF